MVVAVDVLQPEVPPLLASEADSRLATLDVPRSDVIEKRRPELEVWSWMESEPCSEVAPAASGLDSLVVMDIQVVSQ